MNCSLSTGPDLVLERRQRHRLNAGRRQQLQPAADFSLRRHDDLTGITIIFIAARARVYWAAAQLDQKTRCERLKTRPDHVCQREQELWAGVEREDAKQHSQHRCPASYPEN